MKTLTTLLLTLLVSGSLWAQSPEEALYKYFELFNRADKEAINKASFSPFGFLICKNKTLSENYGVSVFLVGLRNQGWAYSKINESELIYADELSAMVDINFSRLSEDDEVLSTTDALYLLVNKDGNWLLKAGFINSNLSLGK